MRRTEDFLTEGLIERMEIQVYKRIDEGKTTIKILEEMRDSFAEMFIEEGIAEGEEAIMAGKKLTLKIMRAIGNKRGIKVPTT